MSASAVPVRLSDARTFRLEEHVGGVSRQSWAIKKERRTSRVASSRRLRGGERSSRLKNGRTFSAHHGQHDVDMSARAGARRAAAGHRHFRAVPRAPTETRGHAMTRHTPWMTPPES